MVISKENVGTKWVKALQTNQNYYDMVMSKASVDTKWVKA